MNACRKVGRRGGRRAFTLLEVLVVMFIIALVYAILLPALERGRKRGMAAKCLSNLHQLGLAYQMFAHDHYDRFPMQISTNAGGTLEFNRPPAVAGAEFYEAFRHFQVLSNELSEPRVLVCRGDRRKSALHFGSLQNSNVSYFIGPDAAHARPRSVLAGDRNLTTSGIKSESLQRIEPGDHVFWTGEIHSYRGNLLFADGSVKDVSNAGLRTALDQSQPEAVVILPPAQRSRPFQP